MWRKSVLDCVVTEQVEFMALVVLFFIENNFVFFQWPMITDFFFPFAFFFFLGGRVSK